MTKPVQKIFCFVENFFIIKRIENLLTVISFTTYEQTKDTRQSNDLKDRLYLLFQALQSVRLGQNAEINTLCLVLSLLTLIPQKTAPCV